MGGHAKTQAMPLRITLLYAVAWRAAPLPNHYYEGRLNLYTENEPQVGAGTPAHLSLPPESFRTDLEVASAFEQGTQTPLKLRPIRVTLLEALGQLSRAFDGYEVALIVKLARALMKVVEDQNLLRGRYAIMVAGACLAPAEQAVSKSCVRSDVVEAMGVDLDAVQCTLFQLKREVRGNGAATLAILGNFGKLNRFPGRLESTLR